MEILNKNQSLQNKLQIAKEANKELITKDKTQDNTLNFNEIIKNIQLLIKKYTPKTEYIINELNLPKDSISTKKITNSITNLFKKNNSTEIKSPKERKKFQEILIDDQVQVYCNIQTKEFTIIQKAPSINRIVISGGGAKGTILPGAIRALKDLLETVEEVAGSSVGAMTAAFIASGMTGVEMEIALYRLKYYDLLGSGSLQNLYKFGGWKKGEELQNFIQKTVIETIKKRLQEIEKTGKKPAKNKATKYLNELNRQSDITFAFLYKLHQDFTSTFKKLIVTATNKTTGKVKYLSANTDPNISIAKACRASASLPIYLTPVQIEADTYVDGGFQVNIPVDAVNNPPDTNKRHRGIYDQYLRTLVLIFQRSVTSEEQGKYFDNIEKNPNYNPSLKDRMIRDQLPRLFGIHAHTPNTKTHFDEMEKIRTQYAQRTIVLNTGHVGTFSFDLTPEQRLNLCEEGFKQTKEQLEVLGVQNSAIHHVVTFKDLQDYLTRTQYTKVLKRLKFYYNKAFSYT